MKIYIILLVMTRILKKFSWLIEVPRNLTALVYKIGRLIWLHGELVIKDLIVTTVQFIQDFKIYTGNLEIPYLKLYKTFMTLVRKTTKKLKQF